jgi:hypothetical protein
MNYRSGCFSIAAYLIESANFSRLNLGFTETSEQQCIAVLFVNIIFLA